MSGSSIGLTYCCYYLVLFLLIVPLPSSVCLLFGTLKQGDTVNSTQSMSSFDQNYVVGFFNIRGRRYLCISFETERNYTTDAGRQIVWVANRNTPILDDSGALTFDENGSLVIRHSGGNPILLYSNGNNGPRSATLHGNGNLVLSELNHDGSTGRILWQSFDYPTDTLLPGMKLGLDYQTGRTLSLTSWLSQENPSSGAFTLDWNFREQELVLKQRGVLVWTSGVLENGRFEHIKEDLLNSYSLMVNNTRSGHFFSFSRFGRPYWKLSHLEDLTFESESSDEQFSLPTLTIAETCFGQDNKDYGCVPLAKPKCRGNNLKVEPFIGDFHGGNGEIVSGSLYENASFGFGDCREICWNDCDCVGFREVDYTGCQFWRGKLEFVMNPEVSNTALDLYIYVVTEVSGPPMPSDAMRNNWQCLTTLLAVTMSMLMSISFSCLHTKHKDYMNNSNSSKLFPSQDRD